MEIKKVKKLSSLETLSLDTNRRFDAAVNEGKILASLGLLGLSYPLEVGAAVAAGEWWYAARLVLFLPLLAPHRRYLHRRPLRPGQMETLQIPPVNHLKKFFG